MCCETIWLDGVRACLDMFQNSLRSARVIMRINLSTKMKRNEPTSARYSLLFNDKPRDIIAEGDEG